MKRNAQEYDHAEKDRINAYWEVLEQLEEIIRDIDSKLIPSATEVENVPVEFLQANPQATIAVFQGEWQRKAVIRCKSAVQNLILALDFDQLQYMIVEHSTEES